MLIRRSELRLALTAGLMNGFYALVLVVGYKVGLYIIAMGWLVHDGELGVWLPMRLFWTVAGIIVALLSLRLFWPDLAVETNRQRLRRFLAAQQLELQTAQRLRRQLVALRDAMAAVADELDNNPSSHTTFRPYQLLNGAGSPLVGVFNGLRLLENTPSDGGPLQGLHGAQAELLRVVADRLEQWNHCLEVPHRHRPAPPSPPLRPPPRWRSLERWLHDPDLDGIELFRPQRNASRLMLRSQALRSIEQGEHRWRTLGEAPG